MPAGWASLSPSSPGPKKEKKQKSNQFSFFPPIDPMHQHTVELIEAKTALKKIAVHCSAVQCTVVQDSAVPCNEMLCSLVHDSEVHCSAMHCSALQCSAGHRLGRIAGKYSWRKRWIFIIQSTVLKCLALSKEWVKKFMFAWFFSKDAAYSRESIWPTDVV